MEKKRKIYICGNRTRSSSENSSSGIGGRSVNGNGIGESGTGESAAAGGGDAKLRTTDEIRAGVRGMSRPAGGGGG